MRQRLLSACRPSASDAFLARRAAAGDDDAFEKLYARYQPRLLAYCRTIVRHDEDARDAVQNAMTKALVALRRQDGTTNVGGWLFRIAHNEAISLLRRRRPTAELPDAVPDRHLGPAADFLLREELRATLDGVRALPPNLQHPLLLRELAGLTYGQVAEVVGGTPAAARKAVFDARTALSTDRAGRDEACAVIRKSLSEGDGRRRRARLVRSHLQSCRACCEWEREQRLRRHHLAALLPAAAAGSGGWLASLFGGSTLAAGVTGGLATNAKVAASLAVIAAGAVPVVEQVERSQTPQRVTARAQAAAPAAAERRSRTAPSTARAAVAAAVVPASRTAAAEPAAAKTGAASAAKAAREAAAAARRERERTTAELRAKERDGTRAGAAAEADFGDDPVTGRGAPGAIDLAAEPRRPRGAAPAGTDASTAYAPRDATAPERLATPDADRRGDAGPARYDRHAG